MKQNLSPNRRIESGATTHAFDRELAEIRANRAGSNDPVYDVMNGKTKKVVGQLSGSYSALHNTNQVPPGHYLRRSKDKGWSLGSDRRFSTMVAMPFGKFKGFPINSIKDKQYLLWVLENTSMSPDCQQAISTQYMSLP